MTSRFSPVLLSLSLWLAPALAGAQQEEPVLPEVLWLVEGELAAGDRAALEGALERSLEVRLVTTGRVVSRLRRLAATLGEDQASTGAARALASARRAYVELRLGEARSFYVEALEALLSSYRAPADPAAVATVFFERALIELAAQRRSDAISLLGVALTIDPSLAPDPEVYGPPLFRALTDARRGLRRPRSLELERAPLDAEVRVDGETAPLEPFEVRGDGPHLVTAARRGYQARSLLVEVPLAGGGAAVVLRRAEGPLLAAQLLEIWDGNVPLVAEAGQLLAAATGISHCVVARREGEQLLLASSRLDDGEVLRRAAGSRVAWEPRPFFVLAETLAGRSVQPPPADAGSRPVSLAVSAPASVVTGAPLVLNLTFDDPDERVRLVGARCGDSVGRVRADGRLPTSIELTSPEEVGAAECEVTAYDENGDVIVRFPAGEAQLVVLVERRSRGRSWVWWVSGSAVVVATAAVVAAVLATRPREQVLVIDGLD